MKLICAIIAVAAFAGCNKNNEIKAQQNKSTMILVHGAGHGSWTWSKITPLLAAKQITTIAIDLPGQNHDTTKLFTHTLADDVAAIKKIADSVQGDVIIVGHSSAGVAIAQAAELLGKGKVEKLIFLDAFMPKNGESVLDLVQLATKNNHTPDTNTVPIMLFTSNFKAFQWNPANVAQRFYHDCTQTDISFAMSNLTWQSSASVGTPAQLSDSVYGNIPKYYILCTKAFDLYKGSIAHNVPIRKLFKLPSSHSPFFSMPGKLVDVFDEIYHLSKDTTVSCASCHKPAFAFADTKRVSSGGRKGSRNTPTAMNTLLSKSFFWDGRASSREEQALLPIANPDEMYLPLAEAVERLKNDERYRELFLQVYHEEPNEEALAESIAAFERTLETNDSPFDNWKVGGDSTGISAEAKRGFIIFNGKGNCITCHFRSDFTRQDFRNIRYLPEVKN